MLQAEFYCIVDTYFCNTSRNLSSTNSEVYIYVLQAEFCYSVDT